MSATTATSPFQQTRCTLMRGPALTTPTSERPGWHEYFMGIAEAVSRRGDCERDQVGAVVVGKDKRIRATGYNGSPAGMAGCSSCPRRTSDVAPGSCYSNCVAIHAELNALLYCDRSDLHGSTLYITREPCYGCLKAIKATGVEWVIYPEGVIMNQANIRDL